ncbi:MAG TPA: lactate racemase domain-containing protein [Acidobacteriota bacterium]|nr:lactate racemase domain-containing protein [Acidobacteriota bacterium]
MKFLTYFGNDLLHAKLPEGSDIYYPPLPMSGIPRSAIAASVRRALENPLGMESLRDLVNSHSRILIAFDDNCQPFPLMKRPDFRQTAIETLLEMLYSYGVQKENILLMCAVALHRKMKPHELEYMLGKRIMSEFFPAQLKNFDAEDPDDIVSLGRTEQGEEVETTRAVIESDLVIYVDTVQIPLNGGHKSVAVGFGTYNSLSRHHAPQMTEKDPHVMQPDGSHMHASIERISRVILKRCRVLLLEAAMNSATYPAHMRFLSKARNDCNGLESALRAMSPAAMKLFPEPIRRRIFRSIRSDYSPIEINAGPIDAVHPRTLEVLRKQLEVRVPRQYDTLVFGLADLSPYSVGARVNPILVVSDVLGYVFNWFYNRPFVKKGGVVIILNPVLEVFHEQYHAAYRKFWDEVLPVTSDPFQMQELFQDRFAKDPELVDRYRNHYAHHGFHPFTVWYWATFPLRYLSKVILVGPRDPDIARRLGVEWAPSLRKALDMAREASGGDDVLALTIPPFMYLRVDGE